MILVDTDVCIAFLERRDTALVRFFGAHEPDLRLCAVVKAELNFGARASARVEGNLKRLRAFYDSVESLDFDDAAADMYGVIRAQLKRSGTPIGPNDLLIAAIALANDASVATRNTGEFSKVSTLRLELLD